MHDRMRLEYKFFRIVNGQLVEATLIGDDDETIFLNGWYSSSEEAENDLELRCVENPDITIDDLLLIPTYRLIGSRRGRNRNL